ncbi:hypothetical protein LO763_02925 [Glycomyces sp. A-F 0318]|uniref:hypothetical protein n=1 Tax=Glycomyces amatae TaxID=2881355 RepID=UPI001E335A8F|nr:hypothetical protein [Glycomyces amatae]MCD0442577.1 hypothetical protein [Glycomyces amatae]
MQQPTHVKYTALLWIVAVAAGVVETALAVTDIARESGLDAGVWMNLGMRSVVYVGALILIANFAKGRRWARVSLVVLLSVIGLAAMVVPAAMELANGEPFMSAVGGDGSFATAFVVVRLAHIAAVLAATALMFSAPANRYFAERAPRPVAA